MNSTPTPRHTPGLARRVFAAVTAALTFGLIALAAPPAAASTSDVLLVTSFPSPTTAGTEQTFTVTAVVDGTAMTDTTYGGNVSFTSSDPQAVLPGPYTFTAADAGRHTFSATLKTAGTQSITATDTVNSAITGTQSYIVVHQAATSRLVVADYPSPTREGTSHSFTVRAEDAYGNVQDDYLAPYVGTVSFTSSDPQAVLPGPYTFTAADAGVHTFSATLATAGTQSITATDAANSSITGTQSAITVEAPPTFSVSDTPYQVTAGGSVELIVTAQAATGERLLGYTGTVHFTSTDPQAVLPADYTFTAATCDPGGCAGYDDGQHTFSATLKTAGTQWITVTDISDSSMTGTSDYGNDVDAAAPSRLTVTGYPSPTASGRSQSFTVTAEDAYGNVANNYLTEYEGTVHFTSSDPEAVLPDDFAFGWPEVHTFSATLNTVGTQSITATDTANSVLPGTQSGIDVQDQIGSPPTVAAGGPYSGDVGSAISINGTAADTDGDSLAISWTWAGGSAVAVCTFADAGSASTTVTCNDLGTYTLTLTADDGVNPPVSSSATLTVVSVAPTVSALSGLPTSPIAANTGVRPWATFTDSPSDNGDVTWDWGDGSTSTGTYLNDVACPGTPYPDPGSAGCYISWGHGVALAWDPHAYTGAGTYTVTLTVTNDGGSDTATGVVTVANAPPTVAAGGPYSGNEGSAISTAGSASDPDGDTVTTAWSASTTAEGGTCSFADASSASTTVTCTDEGTYTLTLTADDGIDPVTDTATLTVANVAPAVGAISGVPSSPIALGTSVTASATFTDPGTLDAHTATWDWGDGTTTDATVNESGGSGTLTGSHSYTAVGTYAVTLTVTDADGGTGTDTMTVTVNPANDSPVAVDDAATTDEDAAVVVNVLANDTDADGDTLTVTSLTDPAHGTLTLNGDGSLTYTPNANYNGNDAFTYTASDGIADSNVATVTVTVNPVNDPPVAVADSYSVDEDQVLTVTVGVLANDSDVDGDTLAATLVAGPAHGTLTLNSDGSFTYTPNANYNGNDAFTYTASDGIADSNVATVTVTVNPVNDRPVLTAVTGPLDPVATNTPVEVSASFTDPDIGDTHTVTFAWNDGTSDTVLAGGSPAAASHDYSQAGIYTVAVTVTDGNVANVSGSSGYIVVYDPSAGFVTGGGWLDSPAGADMADPGVTGRAEFGFVAKYRKGASVPDGQTQFVFRAGNLSLYSSSYDWLVITGGHRAIFKGTATVNGVAGYRFTIWATDGDGSASADTFRIRIWSEDADSTEHVLYDNGTETPIGGGQIVIHDGKEK